MGYSTKWKTWISNIDEKTCKPCKDNKSIGGDIFRNVKGKLPSKPGRIWYEADINYKSGYRGSERIVYSNDGLIFITRDHYDTFIEIV